MKRRMGFVSNSSSCSFVVIGYKISKDNHIKEKLMEFFNKDAWNEYKETYISDWENADQYEKNDAFLDCQDFLPFDVYDNEEDGYSSNTHMVIGDEIARSDDNQMEQEEISVDRLTKDDIKLVEFFDDNVIDYEKIVLTGTRMC